MNSTGTATEIPVTETEENGETCVQEITIEPEEDTDSTGILTPEISIEEEVEYTVSMYVDNTIEPQITPTPNSTEITCKYHALALSMRLWIIDAKASKILCMRIINPRRACAARVTVLGFVCVSVC